MRDPQRNPMLRLIDWDYDKGIPPVDLLAEYNEAMGSPPGWICHDGVFSFGPYHQSAHPPSCFLLAEGPHPAHEHAGSDRLPSFCARESGPGRACGMPPDHPIHRPDRPIEFWEWPGIVERHEWAYALYLLAGGR